MLERLVIVGNGMASTKLVDEITQRAPGRYTITVIGEEPRLAYNRVLLSPLLAGEISDTDIELKPRAWWDERNVEIITGKRVIEIEPKAKCVRLRGGGRLPYSKLVLATGSEAVRLPLAGAELPGVITFRDHEDVEQILARTKPGGRAIVIGGGLLGLEAAAGLNKAGVHVSVVHLMDRLMERQLDSDGATLLKTALESRGIEVILNAESEAIQGRRKVGALRLKNGRSIDTQMIVMAVGIKPRVGLARIAGLNVNRGIVTNDWMQTSADDIYAIGECAEHRGTCYGLVEPAYDQARIVAAHLTGEQAEYRGSILATNLKVSGIPVFSAGDFAATEGGDRIVFHDHESGVYRKLVVRDGRLTGAVLVGNTDDALWYLDLIREGRNLGNLRESIVFGSAFSTQTVAA